MSTYPGFVPPFDPSKQYGEYALIDHEHLKCGDFNKMAARKTLRRIMEDVIPLEYRHKVVWTQSSGRPTPRDPLAQRGAVAWRYVP
jgi:hypothetical protein